MKNEIKNKQQITSNEELNDIFNELSKCEQVYSIALFDILGFSNYVEANRTDDILKLYEKLLDLVKKQKSSYNGPSEIAGDITLAPISPDWKNTAFVANADGYVNVCHFSDTFIIYVNYNIGKQPFWLRDTKYEPYPLLLWESNTEYYPILYEKHHIYLSFYKLVWIFSAKQLFLEFL